MLEPALVITHVLVPRSDAGSFCTAKGLVDLSTFSWKPTDRSNLERSRSSKISKEGERYWPWDQEEPHPSTV